MSMKMVQWRMDEEQCASSHWKKEGSLLLKCDAVDRRSTMLGYAECVLPAALVVLIIRMVACRCSAAAAALLPAPATALLLTLTPIAAFRHKHTVDIVYDICRKEYNLSLKGTAWPRVVVGSRNEEEEHKPIFRRYHGLAAQTCGSQPVILFHIHTQRSDTNNNTKSKKPRLGTDQTNISYGVLDPARSAERWSVSQSISTGTSICMRLWRVPVGLASLYNSICSDLLSSLRLHLRREWETRRITGWEQVVLSGGRL